MQDSDSDSSDSGDSDSDSDSDSGDDDQKKKEDKSNGEAKKESHEEKVSHVFCLYRRIHTLICEIKTCLRFSFIWLCEGSGLSTGQ